MKVAARPRHDVHENAPGSFFRTPLDYSQIVNAEVAIEILNQAKGILFERIYALEDSDKPAAAALSNKARDLTKLQQSIRVGEDALIHEIIATWRPRIADEERFWREI